MNILMKLKNLKDILLKDNILILIKTATIVSFLMIAFVSSFLLINKVFLPTHIYVPYTNVSVSGIQVNEYIKKDIKFYLQEYSEHENVPVDIVKLVFENSLKYEVPINFAFAVAYNESRYTPKAISKTNKNGSYDYGFFQLNSYTYPNVKELMPIDKNIEFGIKYLRTSFDITNSWDLAYVVYNTGAVKNYDAANKKHLENIYKKTREMDGWISSVIRNKIIRDFNQSQIHQKVF